MVSKLRSIDLFYHSSYKIFLKIVSNPILLVHWLTVYFIDSGVLSCDARLPVAKG